MPGIITSSRIRFGCRSSALASASLPSWAVITSKPSSRRLTSTKRTMSRSSSAISTISSTNSCLPSTILGQGHWPFVDQRAERLGRGGGIFGLEDRGPDHEHVSAGGQTVGGGRSADSALGLQRDRAAPPVDRLARGDDLG